MFEPIDRFENTYPKLYEKIIEKIREMMLSGQLKSGEKIPSERELTEMFQVSRVPIREALKTLEFLGVIQNVRGEGMYIRNISVEDLIEKMGFAMEASINTIEELYEVREVLEIKAVRLAALRRNINDIEKMQRIIIQMDQNIKEGKEVHELAIKFHTLIFEASKNKVLFGINEYLSNLLKMARKKTMSRKQIFKVANDFHKKILERIIDQDADGAAQIMKEHFDYSINEYEQVKK